MVEGGRELTFDVQGTTGEYIPRAVDSVRAIVIDNLTPFFDVADVAITTSSVWSDPAHALSNWPYRATVRATPRSDYGDIRDVDSIVVHAFAEATGNAPTVTATGHETAQGDASTEQGTSGTLLLIVLAIVAVAVIVFELKA